MSLDCHVHSKFSDGRLSPSEIVKIAKSKELDVVTITDHDNTNSYSELFSEAKLNNIRVLTGIELTTIHNNFELHILGYGFDINHKEIRAHYIRAEKEREIRANRIIEILKKDFNILLSFNELKKKYGFVERSALAREIGKRLNISSREAANNFIARDKPCYIKPYSVGGESINAIEAVEMIHSAGGFVVLAHPKDPYLVDRSWEEITDILKLGFDGVEAFHTRQTIETSQKIIEIADDLNIFCTAGSDCHGVKNSDGSIGIIGNKRLVTNDKAYDILTSKIL